MAQEVVQSVVVSIQAAAQQFAVADLLPWRLFNCSLLAKLMYNEHMVAHPQAGKLMIVSLMINH